MVPNLKTLVQKLRGDLNIVLDYQECFGTAAGQRVLEHMSKQGYLYDTTFHPNQRESDHREAQRRFVLSILKTLNKNPREILEKLQESEKLT